MEHCLDASLYSWQPTYLHTILQKRHFICRDVLVTIPKQFRAYYIIWLWFVCRIQNDRLAFRYAFTIYLRVILHRSVFLPLCIFFTLVHVGILFTNSQFYIIRLRYSIIYILCKYSAPKKKKNRF